MKNFELHEVGAGAHLSKRGGGSWSDAGGGWCVSKRCKVLKIGI